MPKKTSIKSIVLLGAGNVASHLGTAFQQLGLDILQVYSRSIGSAERLSQTLSCQFTDNPDDLMAGADIYIISVSDDAIADVAASFRHHGSLVIHTSGSVEMDVLSTCSDRYGVFYPLQTFSRDIPLDYADIPVFLEAAHTADRELLEELAGKMTTAVHWVNSADRRQLHIAAVFACNFVNHMYALSAKLTHTAGLPFDLLRPLIRETARKALTAEPRTAQTGPAHRGNQGVMEKHLSLLSGKPGLQKMYKIISEDIMKTYLGEE